MKSMTKKAVLDNLSSLITGLAVLAIIASIIFLIIAETKSQVVAQDPCDTAGATYYSGNNTCSTGTLSDSVTAITETQEATGDIPGWLPIIVVAVVGGLLLGLVRFFRR